MLWGVARLSGFFGGLLGFQNALLFDRFNAFEFGIVVLDILRALSGSGGLLCLGLREFVGVGFLPCRVLGGIFSAFGGFCGLLLLIGGDFFHQRQTLLLGFVLANVQSCGTALDLGLIPDLIADFDLLIEATVDEKAPVALCLRYF